MTRPRSGNNRIFRSGFTLIETLMVVMIIGVLVSLLMPAAMSARESARRLECSSRLRQIGIALSAYESTYKGFTGSTSFQGISFHVLLLPYLDQTVLYNSINFQKYEIVDKGSGNPDISFTTVANTKMTIFLCPSDDLAITKSQAVNYRVNLGIGPDYTHNYVTPDSGNGFLSPSDYTPSADFTDGLSNTVAFCERSTGSGEKVDSGRPNRDFYWLTPYLPYALISADSCFGTCIEAANFYGSHFQYNLSGEKWYYYGYYSTEYNHIQVPNGRVPDGLVAANVNGGWGMSTARSLHRGGVESLFGDGSVHFIQDSISLSIWRAMSTRNEGEVFDFPLK